MTPFSLLYDTSFDYNYLTVFGSLCFASTLPSHRNKFYLRAKACVFIGYQPGIKGYKLYDISSKSFLISRDVVFYESHFHFHSISSPSYSVDPFPDVILPSIYSDLFVHPASYSSTLANNDVLTEHHLASPPSNSANNNISPELFSNHSSDYAPHNQHPICDLPSFPMPRRSTRVIKPPSYLHEFHCNLLANQQPPDNNSLYPLNKNLSYKPFSQSHRTFLLNVSSNDKPQFYHQAIASDHWREAMTTELAAMESNNTWIVTNLPKGKHSINCRWVYKVKYGLDGSVDRYKARLVAKSYTQ